MWFISFLVDRAWLFCYLLTKNIT